MAFQVDISLRYIYCSVHSMVFSLSRGPLDWGWITRQSKLCTVESYDLILLIHREYYLVIKHLFVCDVSYLILLVLVTEELRSPSCFLVFPMANGNEKFPPVLLICLSLDLHFSGWNCHLITCSLNIWPSLRQSSFNFPKLDFMHYANVTSLDTEMSYQAILFGQNNVGLPLFSALVWNQTNNFG